MKSTRVIKTCKVCKPMRAISGEPQLSRIRVVQYRSLANRKYKDRMSGPHCLERNRRDTAGRCDADQNSTKAARQHMTLATRRPGCERKRPKSQSDRLNCPKPDACIFLPSRINIACTAPRRYSVALSRFLPALFFSVCTLQIWLKISAGRKR